jgi:hypothetical protein
MIQPTSTAFQYGPFKGAFLFSCLCLVAWITLFVLAMESCSTNCFSYSNYFTSPCVSTEGYLYCCTIFNDPSGPYYCGNYPSCKLDNTACGGLSVGSWITGSLLFFSFIIMCYAAMKFRKMKQLALLNAQNNGSWGNMNQGYAPNMYNPNQQPPSQYQQYQQNGQQIQGNYQAPRYYAQN